MFKFLYFYTTLITGKMSYSSNLPNSTGINDRLTSITQPAYSCYITTTLITGNVDCR